jgi:hypothetical protein
LDASVTNSKKKGIGLTGDGQPFKGRYYYMFWEYLLDMSFVLISLIGGIVAILFVFIRRSNKRRAR